MPRKDLVPRLSILIPSLGDPQEFESTLASVLQNRPDNVELLVAHACEYHDPYKLGGEVCFLPVPEAESVAALLNAGFEASRSPIIHVLQCGHQIDEDWIEPALDGFDDDSVASVSPVIVDNTGDRIVAAGQGYSRWGRTVRRWNRQEGRNSGRTCQQDCWPHARAAGFYRRSWWRHVRWDETLGDELAAAHYSLTLSKAGRDDAIGRRLRSAVRIAARPGQPRTAWILRRQTRGNPVLAASHVPLQRGAIALRTMFALVGSIAAFPSHRAITGLFGHIAGLLQRSSAREFQARIAELADHLSVEQAEAATLSLHRARERQAGSRSSNKRRAA